MTWQHENLGHEPREERRLSFRPDPGNAGPATGS